MRNNSLTDVQRLSFWKDPAHYDIRESMKITCQPEFYLNLVNITKLIVTTIEKYAKPEMSILEIGCGTGRNLVGLYKAGFKNLSGVDISQITVDTGRKAFPEYTDMNIIVAPIEDVIMDLPKYDVIYSQGCLMHIPDGLEWVIGMLRNRAKFMIMTNEGERTTWFHAWHHDYKAIIESSGEWEQIETHTDEAYPPLPRTTIKRVFLRKIPYVEMGKKKHASS